MTPDQERERNQDQLRLTAMRLIRCLGSRHAMECCRNNQWQGIYEIIREMDERQAARH